MRDSQRSDFRSRLGRRWCAVALAIVLALASGAAGAATLEICRSISVDEPLAKLMVPAGSLFRDDGRADDPLAAFNGDKWQLRLETITDAVIPPLRTCARVQVRITSDSSVKAVSVAENRAFIYAGSNLLIDRPDVSEELLSTKGRVLDQVP
jgi:hypothetical protein